MQIALAMIAAWTLAPLQPGNQALTSDLNYRQNQFLSNTPQPPVMTTVNATSGHNLFVVREASSKTLLDGKLVLKLRRIFGYAIEIKANDRILKLAVGEILPIEDTACRLKFHEIATETRLAKFSVDCEG